MAALSKRNHRPTKPLLRGNNIDDAVKQHTGLTTHITQSTVADGPAGPLIFGITRNSAEGRNASPRAISGDFLGTSFTSFGFDRRAIRET